MLSAAETEKWDISVIPAMNKTIIVTVPKNCTTAQLYNEVKKHPLSPVAVQHVLMSIEGDLENSENKYLSDYDIENRSTIQLTAEVSGGLWPADDYPPDTKPIKTEKLERTTSDDHPDVFGFDNDSPRAIMACGHAVAPLSLALYSYDELENGNVWIRCPDPDCGRHWKFSQIREAAYLTEDESHELERKALFNMYQPQGVTKSCPKCGTFCARRDHRDRLIVCFNCTVRSGKLFEFCWLCLAQRANTGILRCENPECWPDQSLFDILAVCAMTEINGVECPSKRACPKCYTVIEHVKVCKDRTCGFCKYEFCFICLKPYPCKTDVWGTCNVAPRQAPTQICPITKGETRWQITVLCFDGVQIDLNIPADCFVDEFVRMLYNHPTAPKCCGYRVIFNNVRLDNRGKKRLSEYGVQDHSCLFLVINLLGG